MAKRRRTQAVVVIHGVGEQKPMDTLRGFVEAVLPEHADGPTYFSKPDTISEELELRKLQDRNQPRSHFYEYYWAYKVEGTTFWHVGSWLKSLLWRRPSRVPSHLKPLWTLTWILLGVAAASWALHAASPEETPTALPFWIAVAASGLLALVQGVVLTYVGDAARYLSPHPNNIALRQRIRADGIKLLRRLHAAPGDNQRPYYDRIVVVGHSLGSVIAYDILKHLWHEMHRDYTLPAAHDQEALAEVEQAGERLTKDSTAEDIGEFQARQTRLWWEQKDLGNHWLVTDLITLGSPLAHAGLLLANDSKDLARRKQQRELPACPPVAESDDGEPRYSFRVWEKYKDAEGGEHALRAIHHAGPFAVTRWTNLYFKTRFALFGDPISGPLRGPFGAGILDREVTHTSWFRTNTPIAHTSYWHTAHDGREVPAIRTLVDALDRSGDRTYEAYMQAQARDD